MITPVQQSGNITIKNENAADATTQVAPIRLGATCVAEIAPNVFVLLVELEIAVLNQEIERVFVISITPAQATVLIPIVGRCLIVGPNQIPTSSVGTDVNLVCAFVFGGNVFLVFDVETRTTDDFVIVRVPLCTIVGLD